MRKIVSVLIVFLFLSGCGRAWNETNRTTLKQDVNRILAVSAVEAEADDCRMIGTTRAGLCTLELSADEVEALTQSMQLMIPDTEEHRQQVERWQAVAGCRLQDGFGEGETYQVFASQRRAVEGPEQVGAGLEYLLFFYNPDSAQSCIQLEYGYG